MEHSQNHVCWTPYFDPCPSNAQLRAKEVFSSISPPNAAQSAQLVKGLRLADRTLQAGSMNCLGCNGPSAGTRDRSLKMNGPSANPYPCRGMRRGVLLLLHFGWLDLVGFGWIWVGCSVSRSVGRLVGWLFGWSIDCCVFAGWTAWFDLVSWLV